MAQQSSKIICMPLRKPQSDFCRLVAPVCKPVVPICKPIVPECPITQKQDPDRTEWLGVDGRPLKAGDRTDENSDANLVFRKYENNNLVEQIDYAVENLSRVRKDADGNPTGISDDLISVVKNTYDADGDLATSEKTLDNGARECSEYKYNISKTERIITTNYHSQYGSFVMPQEKERQTRIYTGKQKPDDKWRRDSVCQLELSRDINGESITLKNYIINRYDSDNKLLTSANTFYRADGSISSNIKIDYPSENTTEIIFDNTSDNNAILTTERAASGVKAPSGEMLMDYKVTEADGRVTSDVRYAQDAEGAIRQEGFVTSPAGVRSEVSRTLERDGSFSRVTNVYDAEGNRIHSSSISHSVGGSTHVMHNGSTETYSVNPCETGALLSCPSDSNHENLNNSVRALAGNVVHELLREVNAVDYEDKTEKIFRAFFRTESDSIYMLRSGAAENAASRGNYLTHEVGHAIDHTHKNGENVNTVSAQEVFREIFRKELRNFNEHATPHEKERLSYFTRYADGNIPLEIFAELYANLNASPLGSLNKSRESYLLDKYFPESQIFVAQATLPAELEKLPNRKA